MSSNHRVESCPFSRHKFPGIFSYIKLIDIALCSVPADTLTVGRATNGRVLVTYFCYSKTSTRGPEDIHVVDRIMNVLVYSFFSPLLFREKKIVLDFLKVHVFWGYYYLHRSKERRL